MSDTYIGDYLWLSEKAVQKRRQYEGLVGNPFVTGSNAGIRTNNYISGRAGTNCSKFVVKDGF